MPKERTLALPTPILPLATTPLKKPFASSHARGILIANKMKETVTSATRWEWMFSEAHADMFATRCKQICEEARDAEGAENVCRFYKVSVSRKSGSSLLHHV